MHEGGLRMDNPVRLTISLGLLLLLSATTMSALAVPSANKEQGSVVVETNAMTIKLVGNENVPFYFFWPTNSPSEKYKVQMYQFFEAIDIDQDGTYDQDSDTIVQGSVISLASLDWQFSDIITETDAQGDFVALHFNMTSQTKPGGSNVGSRASFTVQFRSHLFAENEAALKFDVVVEGYEFSNDEAMLVLAHKIFLTNDNNEMKQSENEVQFGNAFFEASDTAEATETGTVKVGVSYASDSDGNDANAMIYLAYSHFSGDLVHDPTIGIGGNTAGQAIEGGIGNEILPRPSKGVLLASSLLATIIFLLIPLITYRFIMRKKH